MRRRAVSRAPLQAELEAAIGRELPRLTRDERRRAARAAVRLQQPAFLALARRELEVRSAVLAVLRKNLA